MPKSMRELWDEIPPSDTDAEKATLGVIILKPEKLDDIASIVRPCDFYHAANGTIFNRMLAMWDSRKRPDLVTLVHELRVAGEIDDVGGPAYVAELGDAVPHSGHAEYHARIVRQKARYRSLRQLGADLFQQAQAEAGEPDALVDSMETAFARMNSDTDGGPVSASDAAIQAMHRIDEIASQQRHAGHMTGIEAFDETLGGLFDGELCILAARPGIGKTSLGCQVTYHMATQGKLVYFISLEMSASELTTRVICSQAGVDSREIRTGRIGGSELPQLVEASQPLGQAAWMIQDKPQVTVPEIRRWARRLQRDDLSLIVVDYLQRLTPVDRRISRHEQVGQMSDGLKALARELDVPVLCLTQLSRQSEQDGRPGLHHLRESGSIEQDADVVMFLRQPTAKEQTDHGEGFNAVLDVRKNRNGPLAAIKLRWIPERTMFVQPGYSDIDDFE